MNKGKSIGIISIKGGGGKTTAVINLAHSLSADYGKKVLVIDANFSSPNISLHLGNTNSKYSLQEVLSGKARLSDAIYSHSFGFDVLPSSLNMNGNNFNHLKTKVQQLKKDYDFILLDSSPSLNNEMLATIASSDELYVVSTPDLPTLGTTLRAVKLAREKKMKINGMILNKVCNKNYEIKPYDMERLSGIPLIGVINDNVRVLEALSKVKPITIVNPYSGVSLAYKEIAAKLAGIEYSKPKLRHKLVGYLKDDFSNLASHKFSKGLFYYK